MYDKISGFSDEIAEETDVQFTVLNKLNIRYFEPRGIDGKNISQLSAEEAGALKEKMDRFGIQASSIGSPIGKVRLSEPFEEHFRLFLHVVEIAGILGAKYIRIFSFYHDGGSVWTAEEREEVLKRLRRMISCAEENDVILLHENEKDIYGDTADRCADLMKELYGSHFKAVFDPANFVQCGEDTEYAYGLLKDYIAYMHIKDALYENGRVMPAGRGEGRVEFILKSLFEKGYDGYLSLEPHLGSFGGLSALGHDQRMAGLPEGGEGTFTLAYRALQDILEKFGY